MAIFLVGKKIEENLTAWSNILARCISLLNRIKHHSKRTRLTIDNQTAALIAFEHALRETEFTNFRLMHILGINGYVQEALDCTSSPIDERHASLFLYYLCLFELEDYQYYEVVVNSSGEVVRSTLLSNKLGSGNWRSTGA